VNAGKYFSVILIHFSNIFRTKLRTEATFNVFLGLSLLSTLYSFSWDLYIDWGFFQKGSLAALKKRDIRGFLRQRTLFPTWFYLTSIVSNLVLRFLWALPMLPMLPGWLHNSQVLVSIITIGEGYRRAQWSIIRIENE
jgi:hypothetical protein